MSRNNLIIAKDVETSQADIKTNGASVTTNRMTGNNRPYWELIVMVRNLYLTVLARWKKHKLEFNTQKL
ncbi:hypothetical protein GYW21_10185 [Lactobacillus mellis]|nr:hypothetical protein [Bombilactobacillus mellis]